MKKFDKNIVQNILNEKYFNSCVKIKVKDISKTVDNKYLIKSDLYDEKIQIGFIVKFMMSWI